MLRSNYCYFLELIGLKEIQPYAPLRVLRQFEMRQNVPLWFNMALAEGYYEERIPVEKIRDLIEG